jgi:hypothetical protein
VLTDGAQRFESVHARHEDVEEQEIEGLGAYKVDAATTVTGGNYVVTGSFEQEPQRRLNRIVVVNNEDPSQGRRSAVIDVNGKLNRYPSSALSCNCFAGTVRRTQIDAAPEDRQTRVTGLPPIARRAAFSR